MRLGNFGKRIGANYRVVALIVLNTIIVLLIVNLLASGILDFRNYLRKRTDAGEGRFSFKKYDEKLKELFPDLDRNDIERFLSDTRHVSQTFDTFTQFKEKPFVGKSVNVDTHGFRPIKNQGPWPPNPDYINIFIFGGSTTFGYGVPDYDTIPSYVQELLNSKYNGKFRAYNFGRGGYISSQERILLEKLILAGAVPNVAVFIDGLNDLTYCEEAPKFTNELTKFMDEGKNPLLKNCIMRMPIFKLIFNFEKDSVKSRSSDIKGPITNTIRRYEINMEIIQSISDRFKIEPLFIWQPVPVYKCDQDYNFFAKFDYDTYTPLLRVAYEDMAQVVENRPFGENFLWLSDIQLGLKKPLYADAYHYSPYLCRIIAQNIVNNLETRKIIEKVKNWW